MSDVQTLLSAYPRIYFACHTRHVRDPVDGRVLSAHQASILSHLDSMDPTMVGELADHLGVTASTMSLNLTRLENAGYIPRQRDPAHRRVLAVPLTQSAPRASPAGLPLPAPPPARRPAPPPPPPPHPPPRRPARVGVRGSRTRVKLRRRGGKKKKERGRRGGGRGGGGGGE